MLKDKEDEIIGKRVRIKDKCEAREHGNNEGCICHLKWHVVQIAKRYETPFVGTPSYHIKGMEQRVRRSEVILLKDQSTPLTKKPSRIKRVLNAVADAVSRRKHTDDDVPQAVVREVDGQLVLDDPVAAAFIGAVEKHNCKITFEQNAERVAHFKKRLSDRGMSPSDAVIVVLNVDNPFGGVLADALMPGHNWQEYRDRGEVPYARGLAMREGIQSALAAFDKDAAEKLEGMAKKVPVVVVDHGVAEVFAA